MIGVQDEKGVHRFRQDGIRLETGLRRLPHHRQEVGREVEGVVRVDEGHADAEAVSRRRERRHLRDQADDLLVADVGIEDVLRLGVERRKGGDRRDEDAHRMGVVVEALEETLAHVLMDEGVVRDLLDPALELLGRRQLAEQQQVSHLEVGRLLGQLLDRVPAVFEDSFVAVDEGDRALRRRRRHESRVVEPDARQELGPLLCRNPTVDDRDLDRLTVTVIGDRHALYHDLHLLSASARLTPSASGRLTSRLARRRHILRRCCTALTSRAALRPAAAPGAGRQRSVALRGARVEPGAAVARGRWPGKLTGAPRERVAPPPSPRSRSSSIAARTRKQQHQGAVS